LTSITVKVGSGHNVFTPLEFAQLPLSERVNLMMKRLVEFLDEHGQPIPPMEAVEQLPAGAIRGKR
jgi:hypothetical protein